MKNFLTITFVLVLLLTACGPTPEQIATRTAYSYTATASSWTPTPDFSASVGLVGADLFSGPGEVYAKTGFVLDKVMIIGQAYDCAWFWVNTVDNSATGWLQASQITYNVPCETVPAADIPPTPYPTATLTSTPRPTATFTLTPTKKPAASNSGGGGASQPKCPVQSAMTIGNRTGATATFTLIGPGTFYVTIQPDVNTSVAVCEGCYDVYVTSSACGGGGYAGHICDGFDGWLQCN